MPQPKHRAQTRILGFWHFSSAASRLPCRSLNITQNKIWWTYLSSCLHPNITEVPSHRYLTISTNASILKKKWNRGLVRHLVWKNICHASLMTRVQAPETTRQSQTCVMARWETETGELAWSTQCGRNKRDSALIQCKVRTDSRKLSSDFHINVMARVPHPLTTILT